MTTSRSLLLVDTASGGVRRIHEGSGLYYGIARSASHYFVGARGRMVSSTSSIEDERGYLLVFDLALSVVDTLVPPFPMRDIHQVVHDRGALYVTCSYDNMVARYDGRSWSEWYPLGRPSSRPFDTNHFNTIRLSERTIELLAHNFGESEVLTFDRDSLALVERRHMGIHAHNLWNRGDELLLCSSAEGMIRGTKDTQVVTGGFPRGVAFVGDEIFVGISEHAERSERDLTNGSILVLDQDYRERRRIVLESEGLVLDLMAPATKPTRRDTVRSALSRWISGTRSESVPSLLD